MSKKTEEYELGKLLTALSNRFKDEREKSESYKEMFKAGSSCTGLLRKLECEMSSNLLDASAVLKERHGIAINNRQHGFLSTLPFLLTVAKQDVTRNEGVSCSIDKAFFILSEQFLALGDKDK